MRLKNIFHNSTKFIMYSKFISQILQMYIEYLSCKLFPNCAQFRNALEEISRSSNCPKPKAYPKFGTRDPILLVGPETRDPFWG